MAEIKEHEASRILQAQVRGFLEEDLMAEIKEHEASRIQAAVRGVLTRKQFSMAYLEEFL